MRDQENTNTNLPTLLGGMVSENMLAVSVNATNNLFFAKMLGIAWIIVFVTFSTGLAAAIWMSKPWHISLTYGLLALFLLFFHPGVESPKGESK